MKELEVVKMVIKNKIKEYFTNKYLQICICEFEPNTTHPQMYLFKCNCEITEGLAVVHKFNGIKATITGRIGNGYPLLDAMVIDGVKYVGDEKIEAKLKELTK